MSLLAQAPARPRTPDSVLLTTEGRVEMVRAGATAWTAARTNQTLQAGDRLRTGQRSRASLRLSDLSVLRVNELTTLEIRPPAPAGPPQSLELKSGAVYFFNREKPSELRFRTPLASGAIRGTEFNMVVAANGSTVITMLDGVVDLSSADGLVSLASGEQGIVEPDQPPRKTTVIQAINIIQWALYYPGVLDPDEAGLAVAEQQALATSLAAYRSGDLLAAEASYPLDRQPGSPAERVYCAATLLAVGQVESAEVLLKDDPSPLGAALREMIAAVKNQDAPRPPAPATATEWMAESYYLQSRSRLEDARKAAQAAAAKSPNFGFAWARVAELEFSFGRTAAAKQALAKAIQLAPRHAQAIALQGFVFAARNQIGAALAQFNQAIALDGGLGNAWLGRGLCQIRQGHGPEGRADLQVAATLEPQRAVLRSYLGKAWSETKDNPRAEKELKLAQKFDPNDPTAWLYSALLNQQNNRVNKAVRDLEKSQELNDNRSLFRSRLLLDQDQAARSANLAGIYRDAGMFDVSVREAARAVNQDYANYSAHLFLAGSYYELLDPNRFNLRYESAYLSELLTANLLAPVGAGNLSQTVSPNEYSKLFNKDGLGLSSSTEYSSHGDWVQSSSQYGLFGNTEYALDASGRWQRGFRPNNDHEERFFAGSLKHQFSPQDSLFLQANCFDYSAGDVAQYYAQSNASPTFRVREKQEPNLYLGYHREWSPGTHTLVLLSRLTDDFHLNDPALPINFLHQTHGNISQVTADPNFVRLDSRLEAYSAELQQIWQPGNNTLIAGGRFQTGWTENFNHVTNIFYVNHDVTKQTLGGDLQRFDLYAYDQYQVCEPLLLTAGLGYDQLRYPKDIDTSPIAMGQDCKDRFSPKAGFLWTPFQRTHLRGAYTRSLGGLFFDNSVRLEPTQVGGFNQALRSLIPESVTGLVPGTRFETFGLGLDHLFKSGTYLGIDAELLRSEGSRWVGVLTNHNFIPVPDRPSITRQSLDFEERSFVVTLNQLVDESWSVGARYRLSHAELTGRYPDVPVAVAATAGLTQDQNATLHQLNLYAIFQHRCGFFTEFDGLWNAQSNHGYTPDEPDNAFWQFNAFAGYRCFRRHAEIRLGVLNLAGQDYRLNPLTLYSELPRERTFVASFKFYF